MPTLNLSDIEALRQFLAAETALDRVLHAFCDDQAERYQQDCSQYMSTVPRDTERASDAAAHADAYRTFFHELKFFAAQFRSQEQR